MIDIKGLVLTGLKYGLIIGFVSSFFAHGLNYAYKLLYKS